MVPEQEQAFHKKEEKSKRSLNTQKIYPCSTERQGKYWWLSSFGQQIGKKQKLQSPIMARKWENFLI